MSTLVESKRLHDEMITKLLKNKSRQDLEDLIDFAWGIIANVSNGNWEKQSAEWEDAAHSWGVQAGYRLDR